MDSATLTLYWHDYETWGEQPARDRPSQFAGLRTDLDLNPLGEPLMLYCQPPPDCLPKPEACLVTGLSPQKAQREGLAERDFVAAIIAELGRPNTCGVGYNSIRFDDEVTRYALYRNFYDPYEREWRNGNSRWDMIDLVRMTRALRPEGISWPDYESGRPCFRLEELSKANGLAHDAAHDALSDVRATIALAKLIKQRQPKLYDYAFQLRDKHFVRRLIDIDGHKPLLHISSRYPSERGNAALVLPLAQHPTNNNSVLVFDLSESPEALLNDTAERLRERLFTPSESLTEGQKRPPLKEVHLNKSPMLAPAKTLDNAAAERLGLDKRQAEEHWRRLAELSLDEQRRLRAKLAEIYASPGFGQSNDPEQQLYQGFLSDQDRQRLPKVRRASAQTLASADFGFEDSRLPELLFRYRARNFPESLNAGERKAWRRFCYRRLTDPEAGASLTWDQLQQRLTDLRAGDLGSNQRALLQELEDYARAKLKTFEPD